MMRVSMLLLLALAGCEWVRLPVDDGVYDADEDGFTSLDDCDDFNENVHPGAEESCNGVDNDCSGSEDDASDAGLWYPDVDGDGFGDPGAAIRACEAPLGYTDLAWDCDDGDADVNPAAAESDCADPRDYNCDGLPAAWDSDLDGSPGCEDCDDADPTTFPGAEETCDLRDEDCDGLVDEGLAGTTWYLDADGDGWGDPATSTQSCWRPSGHSADPTDCDDTDAAVHPSAAEACNAADDDCDGEIDEPDRFGNTRWYADADGDGAGDALDWVASCEPVAGRVAADDDCDDTDADVRPGAVEHCDSVDEDCDGTVDDGAVDPLPWYRDADRDNWGTDTDIAYGCSRPTGYVATPGDCDDTSRGISPDDRELCGGVDEDCDGEYDEAGAAGGLPWYPDLDGDGYGDDAAAVEACTAPAGMTEVGGDCDDTDDVVHPDALEIDCGDPTDYNCDGAVGRVDNDGDGFDACEECDDGDAARSPDAAEVCDGVDEDCDGDIDDDATDALSWYADADGDGYGADGSAVLACEAPEGFVQDVGDCDDADAAVSPAATETCATDADDDCDGDANIGGTGCVEWHADADGDGYGDADALCLCAAEWPYVADDAEDCDDAAPAVNPDGVEACGNDADDDCDGYAEGCGVAGRMSLADADGKLTGAASGDSFGLALVAPGDLDGDGVPELFASAPAADDGATDGGAVYHFDGPFDGTAADATTTWLGTVASAAAGTALAAGDPDGDGDADLVIGSPYDGSAGTSAGAVRLYEDALLGGGSAPDGTLTGTDANDMAGNAVAFVTDGDGDGVDELVVGAYRESLTSGGAGAVYVIGGLPAHDDALWEQAEATLLGEGSGDFFGRSVADGGDIDGDGLGDLLVGAYAADTGGTNTGAAYVFYGPLNATISASEADAIRHGTARSDGAGFGLAGGGDVDGDGYADFVVGAFNNDDGGYTRGAAYVVRGPVSGTAPLGGDATLLGEADSDSAGRVVALGDLDADGFSDVAVSADANGYGRVGGVWVAYGPLAGVMSLADVEARVLGEDADDAVGEAIAIGGDHDGDGFPELFVGAPDEDSASTNAGAVYVIGGGPGL